MTLATRTLTAWWRAEVARVVNVKHEPCDVYIGRKHAGREASPWGNPYFLRYEAAGGWTIWRQTAKGWEVYTSSASRALIVRTMLDLYRIHVRRNLRDRLPELVGKRLGCWCAPGPCHGDVLLELLVEFKLDGPDENPQGDLFGGPK